MNITQQEQTHKYRKQTSGYWWGEERGKGKQRDKGLRGTNYHYKINKLRDYIINTGKLSHYFIISLNGK